MNIMKKLILLTAIVYLTIGLTSCSKDESSSTPPTNKELLTSKIWKVTSKIITPSMSLGGFEVSNILTLESEEVRNYSFKYNMDGTLFQYDYLNALIFQTGWSISSDQTQVTFTQPLIYTYPIVGDLSMTSFKIQSITTVQMVATIDFLYEGINYVVTITFI